MPRVQQKKHIILSRKEHGDVGDGQNSLQLIAHRQERKAKGIWDMRFGM